MRPDASRGPSTSPLADMGLQRTKQVSLVGAVGASILFAVYDGWLNVMGREPGEAMFTLFHFVLTTSLATWLVADATQLRRTQPTFDHGWFILTVFFVYVPYYLISSRRWRGLAVLLGIILLFLLPSVAEMFVGYVS